MKITLVDTGDTTLTAGRLARVREHLRNDLFCFTYGDGVADVNISALLDHHLKICRRLATLTAVQPPGRFGVLELEGDQVNCFHEKPDGDNA